MTHTYTDTLKYFAVIASLNLVLVGCTDGGSLRTSTSIIGEGWASPPEPYDPPALYCYSTLGAPDCHAVPLANAQTRVKGSYAGPPALPLRNSDEQNVDVENISIEMQHEDHLIIREDHNPNPKQQPVNIHHIHREHRHKSVLQQPLYPVDHK